jgi:seryl-tRNA synthetase
MKKPFLVLIFVLAFCVTALSQENACPKISITAPQGLVHYGDEISFVANVNPASDRYAYKWTASAGNIEGQATSRIKIRADKPEMESRHIQVTVEVAGLPQNCPKTASEIVPVTADERFVFPIDTYGKISLREEKAKLDLIADRLKPDDRIVIIFVITFSEKDNLNLLKNRVFNISRHLTEKRKIPKNKFNFLFGESGFYETSIHVFSIENAEKFPRWEQSINQLRPRKRTFKKPAARNITKQR